MTHPVKISLQTAVMNDDIQVGIFYESYHHVYALSSPPFNYIKHTVCNGANIQGVKVNKKKYHTEN